MRLLTILGLRFRSFFSRARVEAELDEELQYHLKRDVEERVAAGMAGEDARYAALQSLKDIEQRKEDCRDARALNLLQNVAQDIRYALRQLRKDPPFACTAVVVLALGIAATVAIFSFVESALIKPLPYRAQSRLVAVFESSPGAPRSWLSYLDFADWRRLNRVFSSLDAYALNGSFTLSSRTGAEQVPGTRVSASFFRTLGVTPELGRDFRPGEDSAEAIRTVVLSYAVWQKRFGERRDVLGRSVTLNGSPTVIIGVLPKAFQFAPYGGAEFWATLRSTDSCEQHRDCHNLVAIGRLKDGISIDTASAYMRSVAQRLRREYPDTNRYFGSANLVPLRDFIVGDILEDLDWGTLYVPAAQKPVAWPAILVRSSQVQMSLLREIPKAIHRIDPFITVSAGETMTERISQSPSAYLHSSSAWLVGSFASAALLLGIVGFYGVVAYSVSQRTREIGVRMAVGARRGTVYKLVLSEAGRLTAFGIVLGLLGSLAAATLFRSMLFGVRSWDPATLLISAGVLALSGALASFIPARRAASVNPIEALRGE